MSGEPELLALILVAAVLLAYYTALLFPYRTFKSLRRFFQIFSPPHSTVSKITSEEYDVPEASLAARIIESWFPHSETEVIEGAPYSLHGTLNKSMSYNRAAGEIALQVFYDIPLPIGNVQIPARRAQALLKVYLNEKKYPVPVSKDNPHGVQTKTSITYEWEGAETAVTDMFSVDYKVLHYLIDRTDKEFLVRKYKKIGEAAAKTGAITKAKAKPKQWWRTYNAAPGTRVYSFWPTPQDYAESVQNPQQNFKDEGLQNCQAVLNEIGIPRVRSGMFASVYEFENEFEQWAVRCFDTRLIDQQERYKAISSFILADDLPYTVDFHYIEEGIKCGDTWFPILKMVWVEGQTLDVFIKENLNKCDVLEALRTEFQTMMVKLRANNIAHGDLQHGNILISDNEIYLVDYDGFYVPELAGRHSNELGHANYQHPKRTEKFFGPYLDNFSAWVIDLSLLFLIEDPSLFQRFSGGDECILFRKADFDNPQSSRLVMALQKHENPRIRRGIECLLALLNMSLDEIPFLYDWLSETIQLDKMQKQI